MTTTMTRTEVEKAVRAGKSLRGANLWSADLQSADLRGADLREADLTRAHLSGANLSGANLHGANLHGVREILTVDGLPSRSALLLPTVDGWQLEVGCWDGTTDTLRELIAQDDGWPDAQGDQILVRRPMLAALADMCDAWAVDRQDVLDAVIEKWGTP